MRIERSLGAPEVLLDCRCYRLERFQVGAAKDTFGTLACVLSDEQVVEAVGGTNRRDARALGARPSKVVEQILHQLRRHRLRQRQGTVFRDDLELLIEKPEQTANRYARLEPAIAERLDDPGGDPPQAYAR